MHINVISSDRLDRSKLLDQWNSLLQRSSADPLFGGWSWVSSWWSIWGEDTEYDLHVVLAYHGKKLVGLAPLYVDRTKTFFGYVDRLQFVGNAWGRMGTVRSEYLGLILDNDYVVPVTAALLQFIYDKISWDEWIICDSPNDNVRQLALVFDWAKRKSLFKRNISRERSVVVDTSGNFAEYVSALGRNTRLKLFNHRKCIEAICHNRILQNDRSSAKAEFFKLLNSFHSIRWGKPCFIGKSLRFHSELLHRLPEQSGTPYLQILSIMGQDVSALYDIRLAGRQYNIQAGFEEKFDKKLSLGTLHIGYAIEDCFSDNECREYDLLVGSGKKEYYKTRYRGRILGTTTFQLVRNRRLIWVYRAKGLIRKLVKIPHNRVGLLNVRQWISDTTRTLFIGFANKWPCNDNKVLVVGSESAGTTAIANLLFAETKGVRFLEEGDHQWVWKVYQNVYQQHRKVKDYPRLRLFDAVKVPGFATIIDEFREAFPNTKVIYVVRDPRDYVNSAIKTWKLNAVNELSGVSWCKEKWLGIGNVDPIERLSIRWKMYLQSAMSKDDVTFIKYEDFCENKVEAIEQLALRSGIAFNRKRVGQICDIQLSHSSVRDYRPEGPGGWETGILEEHHIEKIEQICRKEMEHWGYKMMVGD